MKTDVKKTLIKLSIFAVVIVILQIAHYFIFNKYSPPQLGGIVKAAKDNADILYLPRTFLTYHSNLMKKTCLPSKIADYLAAGTPILVFAPEDSCLSAYAKKHGIALILNELNSSKLSQYFYKLLEDNSLREKLVKNVKKIKEKHRASVVSLKLQKTLFG